MMTLIVGGFVAIVGLTILATQYKPLEWDLDLQGTFGDPCREETVMPPQPVVATDRSWLIGWEAECLMIAWTAPDERHVTTRWYYATSESRADVLSLSAVTAEQYLASESLSGISVRRDPSSVEGWGTDITDQSSLTVRVFFFDSRPTMYRPRNVKVPAEFSTYYAVEVTARAANAR